MTLMTASTDVREYDRRGRPRWSRIVRAGVALAASTVLVIGASTSASARTLSGQVISHNAGSTLQESTFGNGTYLEKTQVIHWDGDGFPLVTYCGAQAKVWGTLANGRAWSRTFGYAGGCDGIQVDETTNPNQYFRGGSSVWAQSYHNGEWNPGIPGIYA